MKFEDDGRALYLTLTEQDWKYFKPGCLAFVQALKDQIPSKHRSYDDETKQWTIARQFSGLIHTLKIQHLEDPDQGGLFQ